MVILVDGDNLTLWKLREFPAEVAFVVNPKGSGGRPVIHTTSCWTGMPDYAPLGAPIHVGWDGERFRQFTGLPRSIEFCQSCTCAKA